MRVSSKNFLQRGNSYWLTRFIILRLLGFIYAVAFLVAAQQLVPLIGAHGLTPANHFLESIQAQLGSRTAGMLRVPTLFWFGISDNALSIFSWIGFGLSLVVLGGYANAILLASLWAMYMSIVHVGQIWYGYGWEIQLLETGPSRAVRSSRRDRLTPSPTCTIDMYIAQSRATRIALA